MKPSSPASPLKSSTLSSPLHDYLSSKDDPDNDPPSLPPLDIQCAPKWSCDTVDAARPLAGDPIDACRTHS